MTALARVNTPRKSRELYPGKASKRHGSEKRPADPVLNRHGDRIVAPPARSNALYLAGPGVFSPDANAIGRELKALCARYEFEGLWPGDETYGSSQMIFIAHLEMLRRSAAVLADISPFRGPHADPGTAFEIGLAYQAGIPVFAYTRATTLPRSDEARLPSELVHRVRSTRYARHGIGFMRFGRLNEWEELVEDDGCRHDEDGNLVEDWGLVESLMVARALKSVSVSAEEAIGCVAEYFGRAAVSERAQARDLNECGVQHAASPDSAKRE